MARESPWGRGGSLGKGAGTGLRRGTELTVGGVVLGLAQVMGVSVINLSAWLQVATMRLNQNILLLGKKVALVPYTSEHVPRYHEWMKSEELQRLTASEPLTLEQEYEMQRSWRDDADKCTFIVLDAEKWQAQLGPSEESCMAGDVNLFLTDPGDPSLGEIEVMIAEWYPYLQAS
ncbi:alpha/beta-tubulin-N-acetyltransferase 9 isoform X4 [Odocoileus virginianus]|uniref:Alpha/beta-tubulin-N-acetyltransferase 9 isoform X4 n=1 Tax=Odocoileus virginianus TaxID=9874 RepID=A0ABM4J7S7_ODOVR